MYIDEEIAYINSLISAHISLTPDSYFLTTLLAEKLNFGFRCLICIEIDSLISYRALEFLLVSVTSQKIYQQFLYPNSYPNIIN